MNTNLFNEEIEQIKTAHVNHLTNTNAEFMIERKLRLLSDRFINTCSVFVAFDDGDGRVVFNYQMNDEEKKVQSAHNRSNYMVYDDLDAAIAHNKKWEEKRRRA